MSSYLDGKALLTRVLRLYAMHETIQQDETASKDEFREQRRRKRNPSDEKIQVKKKNITQDPKALPQVAVRNFFAPLRTHMETEDSNGEKTTGTEEAEQEPANQAGRPPPIILTSTTNLLQLQKKVRGLVKGSLSSVAHETEPELSQRNWRTFQPLNPSFRLKNCPILPSIPNP
jgi:hypothetical protein